MNISDDGINWREVSSEAFAVMLDDESVDCWVDISSWYEERCVLHVTLKMLRRTRAAAQKAVIDAMWYGKAEVELVRPDQLLGIPVVYED